MPEQNANQQNLPILRMQKMYIKDFSFENPNAPKVYLNKSQDPKVEFNLGLKNTRVDEDHCEVSINITAKLLDGGSEAMVSFIVEIEHAAVFLMKNIPEEHHERVLAIDCPSMLYPFTRQILCQAISDGGFIPFFMMEPINFAILYENAKRKGQQSEN